MYKKLKFDLARNSLRYLIKTFDIKEIYIPYYLCDVIRHSIIQEGCKPIFYHIDDNFYPSQDFPKDSYILYPNYFGICGANVDKLEQIYPKLIVDNAHAFYLPPQGFACFNAEHKFNPQAQASYLYIKNENNNSKNYIYPYPQERIKEFEKLHEQYRNKNRLNIDSLVIHPLFTPRLFTPRLFTPSLFTPPLFTPPFVYPFLASSDKEADELADKLTKSGKTIYRYWNNLPQDYNEYKFYRRLVPIPLT